MKGRFHPSLVTGNDLRSGEAVWLDADGRWTRDPRRAQLFTDPGTAEARLGWAQSQHHLVVGVYLAEAIAGPDGPAPAHFRESFRMRGPSNYAHGKQATGCRG